MRQSLINRLRKQIAARASAKYEKKLSVSISDMMPLNNHKCHLNAVHSVKHRNATAVIECVMVDDSSATAHYVSLMSNGDIFDHTLGWSWSGADYRFIRYVPDSEYEKIHNSLSDLKTLLCGELPWYCKLLRIDKWDLC